MKSIPRQKLVDLVARFGRDLYSEPRRCESLLRDLCQNEHRREVFVLVAAAQDGVAGELAAGLRGILWEATLTRLAGRLQDNFGLAENVARWAVESWAVALGVDVAVATTPSMVPQRPSGSEHDAAQPAVAERSKVPPPTRSGPRHLATSPAMTIDPAKAYSVAMYTTAGMITIELWPDVAPGHVNSFVFLARQGFYVDSIFHRVIPGFMIQGGDPTGTGTGGPGYRLEAEFNERKHTRGVLSAARSNDLNSAGSQFFLMLDAAPHLDGQYTAFGRIIVGFEVIDQIAQAPKDNNDRPKNPTKIRTMTVFELSVPPRSTQMQRA